MMVRGEGAMMGLGEFIKESAGVAAAGMLVVIFFCTFIVSMQFAADMVAGEPLDDWWDCQQRAAVKVVERWKPDFFDGSN